jgi:HK97 family phage major capsid protein
MTLAEIKTMRATCRAKVEDLLGRTANRELSTEEGQMLADLKSEGERLGSLENRYAILESFDKPGAPAIVRPPLIAQPAKENGNAPDAWIDPHTGQHIRVLAPKDRMVDLVEPSAHSDLSVGKCLRGIVTGRWDNAEAERKAMTEGTLGSGGYLLPSPLSAQIIDKVRNAACVVRAGAITVPMDAASLAMARVTADPSCAWHSENAEITASEPTFDRVNFAAHTLASLATMSVELFEDVANADSIVTATIGKVLALELDRACLLGTGVAPQPKGIRNQTSVVIDSTTFGTDGAAISTTTPTGAVGWDWLAKQISALWGVNENPNAVIYAPRTAGELDLLRATTGEPLGPPNSVANLQRLFTNQIPINQTQGGSSDCSSAFVGDFSAALIGMRRDVVVEVSRFASVGSTSLFSTLGVGIRAYLRADFQVARPGAFRVVTGIR